MATKKTAATKKTTMRAAKKTARPGVGRARALSADEREALRNLVQERRGKGQGEDAVLARIASMPQPDRGLAERFHAIVRAAAPQLTPKTWYGMPAYASADGKVVCFFQDAAKFKARYATVGFSDSAALDDGTIWPTTFAVTKLTAADEARMSALVKKATR